MNKFVIRILIIETTCHNFVLSTVQGGLTIRESCQLVEAVWATGHLKAMDLVEVNPTLADAQGVRQTVDCAKTVLLAALAGHRGL